MSALAVFIALLVGAIVALVGPFLLLVLLVALSSGWRPWGARP